MSERDTFAGLQMVLEYAVDELNAVGLHAAAKLVADAMIFVEHELEADRSGARPKAPVSRSRAAGPQLVFDRTSAEKHSDG